MGLRRSIDISKDLIQTTGVVIKVLPSTIFLVELDNGYQVRAYLSGKMRKHKIRILEGDKVDVELSVYNLSEGRIIYRYK